MPAKTSQNVQPKRRVDCGVLVPEVNSGSVEMDMESALAGVM